MKKNRKSFILAISCLSVLAGACAFAGINAFAEDKPAQGLSEPLAATARLGEIVQVPDYYQDGVKATANILTPSGTVYSGTQFTVREGGRHIVEYVLNGAVVYTDECIAVLGGADMLSVNALANVEGLKDYEYNPQEAYKGVAVNVTGGSAAITFDREILMDDFSKNDLFFEAIVEPSAVGVADFKQMIITLADPTDESCYLRLTVTDGHADGGSPECIVYVNGAANGQTAGGYSYNEGTGTTTWKTEGIYGAHTHASFRAVTENGYSDYSLKLYYDAEEKAFYMPLRGTKRKVVDFDDPSIFGGNAWGGFKSGKAKLTVSFAEVSGTGTVIFNEIAGLDLRQEVLVDDVAPQLTIDMGREEKAPNALLGAEYTLFPASAYDFFDSNVQITTRVSYENIFTGETSDILVTDGKFVTDKLGRYTLDYEAIDYSGNRTSKSLSFDCIAEAEEIVLTKIPDDFMALVFEPVQVPSEEAVRAFGGNGTLTVTMRAIDPDGEEIALFNASFVPEKLGEYQIVYQATDYYGVYATQTLRVNVQAKESTKFAGGIVLPDLLIAGFEYTIPNVSAKTCYQGKVLDCVMEYIVNGLVLDETRTFVASAADAQTSVVCRALVNDGIVCDEISKIVTVIDGEQGKDQAAYFYNQDGNMQVTEEQESVDLIALQDASVQFANKLKGSSFTFGGTYFMESANFEAFNVTLSDATNEDICLTFKFRVTDKGFEITTPSGQTELFPSADKYFKMTFDCTSGIVSDADGNSVTYADKDDNGNPFVGFADGLYASFSFSGVFGESKIALSWLNNQTLGYRSDNEAEYGDKIGPEIEIGGELSVVAAIGDEITLYAATAYDVLNQVRPATVQLQSPSGQIVLAETVVDKDITVQVTEKGNYKIFYIAYDTAGQRTRLIRNVSVNDALAPTLEVDFEDTEADVGDKIRIPDVTVSDESGKVYYDVFLILPNSEVRFLLHYDNGETTSYLDKDDNRYPSSFKVSDTKFKLESVGKYTLVVWAYDGDENLAKQSFTIMVK